MKVPVAYFALLPLVMLTTPPARAQLPATAVVGEGALLSADFVYSMEKRPTPECHASTIVETEDGLVAAWFGGTYEKHPDVGIWVSRNAGDGWSQPVEVADGSESEVQDFACWNPVLFQPTNGPLLLFYKVGPSPELWWGVMMTSTDGGVTWKNRRRLGTSDRLFPENRNLIGPVKNKPVQLADGTILCASSTENQGWRVHFELTRDLGKSWQVVGPLAGDAPLDAIQPSILTLPDGRLQILCRTKQKVIGTSYSSDNGQSWTPVKSTSLPNPNSGTDALTLEDGRQLLVYNHSVRAGGANGRQILNVAISSDGMNWETVMTLENESNRAGYSYPAVIQAGDGRVHITYTWRRQLIKHVVIAPERL